MNNFYNTDNFFWRWFGKLADVMVLSILWLLCCLPVVTIAPSCIALYDAIARCIHGPDEHPYKRFFRTFKAELLRGIGITVLWAAIGFVLMLGYSFLYQMGETSKFAAIYSIVYLASMLIPLGIVAWLIPIESRFSHSFLSLHKTAATFSIVHLPTTAVLLGLLIVAVILLMFFPVLAIVLPGILVTVQCWFVEKVFKKYIPEEPAEGETQEENTDDTAV